MPKFEVFAIEEARHRLEKMLGVIIDWSTIETLVPEGYENGRKRRSGIASTLSASLEMARDGVIELRQMAPFAPLYLRARKAAPANTDEESS